VTWEELDGVPGSAYFTVGNMPQRLASLRADPWEGFRIAAAPLQTRTLRSRKVD
jgi:bifunctional non-homologous end joining protein LigD